MLINVLIVLGAALLGSVGVVVALGKSGALDLEKRREKAEKELRHVKEEAREIIEKAKDDIKQTEDSLKADGEDSQRRINNLKSLIGNKEALLKKREEKNNNLRLQIASIEEEIQSKKESIRNIKKKSVDKLCEKTGSSVENLKQSLIEATEKDVSVGREERLQKAEEYYKENAQKIAKKILQSTMQRISSPTTVETKALNIRIPRDSIKIKIIGNHGENLETLEELLDVDIVFNDLPNTITLSTHSLFRRRIAEKTIQKLIAIRSDIDRKIIEKNLQIAEEETDKELYNLGKQAVETLRLKNITDPELLKIIGRLQFRTSYGQNIMKHSIEVAWTAMMLGSELGLNVQTCKIGAFLHDLGKAIDQDPGVDESHDILTKQLMEKYGFAPEEVHAAWTHHEAAPLETPEAFIVMAADAVSAGRPGARQESIENYSERIQQLEKTALEFEGVQKTFAISAGREIRVITDPEKLPDSALQILAGDIAKKIESDLAYPGKIKVNVIRRTDHIATAR